MTTHELKILPEYYRAVIERRKAFEIRRNDRNFQVGDELHLREHSGDGYERSMVALDVATIAQRQHKKLYRKNSVVEDRRKIASGKEAEYNAEIARRCLLSFLIAVVLAYYIFC